MSDFNLILFCFIILITGKTMKSEFFNHYEINLIKGSLEVANQEIYFSEHPQQNQHVVENTEIFIKCNVSDPDGILIQWQLNDEILLNTSRRFQIDSYLYIKSVDRNLDDGEFKCIATNIDSKYSIESSSGILIIHWLYDNITVISENNFVPMYLTCLVYGSKFNIKWYKNGERYIVDFNLLTNLLILQ